MEQVEYTPAALAFPVQEALVQVCRESFGSKLRALALTGSVARNEASYVYRDGQAILLSDIEAVVVLHDDAPLPSSQAVRLLCELAEERLAASGVRVHVSLSMVHGAYLRHLPPHIYSYELRTCGLVLFGEETILEEEIPNYAASDLSTEDAWRMLSNRLIEQMEGAVEGSGGDGLQYRSVKLCLDLAASLLVFCGQFEAGYRARLRRIEEFAMTPGAQQLPVSMEEFLPLVRWCTTAKLQPEAAGNAGLTEEAAPGTASWAPCAGTPVESAGFAGQVTRWAWQSWVWELRRMTGKDESEGAEEMIRAFGHGLGRKRLLRGWLYAMRRVGWLRSARHWPKWLWLMALGLTPRYAIYLAAYRWQQARSEATSSDARQEMKAVIELLPVGGTAQEATAAEVARELAWNYKEFVTETRA
ncbi:MAG: hypothetical protein ABSD13_12905 [Candidatus Korobacteraceae bacterium]|jgi:hypothetical protein